MKILLFTSEFDPVAGGIGTYAREIALAATELEADVTVVAPDYGGDRTPQDRRLPFAVRRYRGGLHSMRHLPAKVVMAREHIASNAYDLIHAADWPFFIPVALSRGLTRARIVMTVHGTEINETQAPIKRLAIRCARVFGPRTSIVANSGYTSELFRERFAVGRQHIRAIPLGVSDFWFGKRKTRAATRSSYGIDAQRVIMVTVARITRRKGHLLTLQALATLPERLRGQITWLIAGPDGEADCIAELHAVAGRTECDVRFLGSLPSEDIRDIYNAADFFCLTGVPDASGRVEGFGLVYLEAGAAGLPSLATDIGGVSDAVIGDDTGLLVSPCIEEIARALATLAEDSDARRTLAAGAQVQARRLSWRRCAADTYGLPRSARHEAEPGRSRANDPASGAGWLCASNSHGLS